MSFNFKGEISSSKSLVNRFLILQAENSDLQIKWKSEAKDVLNLKNALLSNEKELWVGQGGTTLRFLSLYLSAKKGTWVLKGEKSLFKRPQEDLIKALSDLGAQVILGEDYLEIQSEGWKVQEIKTSFKKTSQVATAILLAAASLKKGFSLELEDFEESSGYFKMTLDFLERFGIKIDVLEDRVEIKKSQKLETKESFIEGDWSTAAFIYSAAILSGSSEIENINPVSSLQPDAQFFNIIESMGVVVEGGKISKTSQLKPIEVNLRSCPDLFPVLSILACFSDGYSELKGAPQLKYKESNRIDEIAHLIGKCGYEIKSLEEGLGIYGQGDKILDHQAFDFDCSHDHRLVMASVLLKFKGYNVNILGIESIEKSFPGFFKTFKGII